MKFIYFSFFLLASLTIAQQLAAQNSKYIEINASDTIILKPIEFTYEISLGGRSFPFNLKVEDTSQQTISLIEIENLLTKNKFLYEVKDNSNYSISPNRKPDSIIALILNSESELKRLYKILIKIQGISGRITDKKFESLSNYKDEIYTQLFLRASQEANDLAKISGHSIGQLISVHELQADPFSGYLDSFKEMFTKNDMFSGVFGYQIDINQRIEKKLVFKFEMK